LTVSTGKLKLLPAVHLLPINLVVSQVSIGKFHLGIGFPLRCFQRLSDSNVATLRCAWQRQQEHQGLPHPGPLVLGANFLKLPTLTADRGRPVSRRSEPSSRTALIGEQTNPWDLLQPQDAMSRHRGSKPRRR